MFDDPEKSVSVPLSLIHTIWNLLLTLGGGGLLWFAKEAKKALDAKADKQLIEEKFDDLNDTMKTLALQLQNMHTANTQRIDSLLHTLIEKKD